MYDGREANNKGEILSRYDTDEDIFQTEEVNYALRKATRLILRKKKAVIEEQRLNAVLQMISITLHELNQPLTSLLGNTELIEFNMNKPEKLLENIKRINDAGKRMSKIVKKLQEIRKDENPIEGNGYAKALSGKELDIFFIGNSYYDFAQIKSLLGGAGNIKLTYIKDLSDVFELVEKKEFSGLLFLDEVFLTAPGMDVIKKLKSKNKIAPIVIMTEKNREDMAFNAVCKGADEFFFKSEIDAHSLFEVISNAVEAGFLKQKYNLAVKKMAEISIKDELTGLFQSRFFKDALSREKIRAKRKDAALYVCRTSIDDFNEVSSMHDRDTIDRAIKNIAHTIKNSIGENNILCRCGYDSFASILTDMSLCDAENISESLKKSIISCLDKNFSSDFKPTINVEITDHFTLA